MTLGITEFFALVATHPVLLVILFLIIVITIIAGATDAPNAIASAVATRALPINLAIGLGALFNFIGLFVMIHIAPAVADTMFTMVDFSGDSHMALLALLAAMIAAIAWGAFCWICGIPGSKSHMLIAGITGAALALNGLDGIVIGPWMKVIYGMIFSLVAGFIIAFVLDKILVSTLKYVDRRKTHGPFKYIQIVCSILLSFLHGSQDGQKFMAIALLAISLALGSEGTTSNDFPLWLLILISLAIGIGTTLGAKKIIKSVALSMVKIEPRQGVATNISTVFLLLFTSLAGMPVSTSHCATSSLMGVGASKNPKHVDWKIAKNIVFAWVLTFPCCGILGFGLANLFMMFF
ncbi:MAG: inorganic phosphate transporter [Coriobacteriales bacterium]|nr:inorganic phosphate transporter [Coriobacteriales bacterium]